MTTMPIELYTDGSALNNPNGAGGLGYMIRYYEADNGDDPSALPVQKTIEGSQGFRLTTNNRMEIMALLYGIRMIIEKVKDGTLAGASRVNAFSDSQYLCNAINQRWIAKWQSNNWMTSGFQGRQPTPVKNKDLWEDIIKMQEQLVSMNIAFAISHVKGHDGDPGNEKVDQLATAASRDTNNHLIDEAYEKIAGERKQYRE